MRRAIPGIMVFVISAFAFWGAGCQTETQTPGASAKQAAPRYDRLLPIVEKGKWGFVDTLGNEIVKPQYEYVHPSMEGLAAINVGGKLENTGVIGGKWGFVDTTGKVVIEPTFEWVDGFSEGLCAFNVGGKITYGKPEGGKWGYFDRTGKIVISAKYDEVYRFNNGLARARLDKDWNFLTPGDRMIATGKFSEIALFSGGMAAVRAHETGFGENKIPGKWGYINVSGMLVIHPKFEDALAFDDGVATVVMNGQLCYIDSQGRFIWPRTPPAPRPQDMPKAIREKYQKNTKQKSEDNLKQ